MITDNKAGTIAYIHYRGGVKGEEPLDDRTQGEPLKVMLGDMQLPRGIENAVFDMEVGETREVEIPCEEGYGEYQEKYANWYPKTMINNGYDLELGDVIFWTNPDDGRKMPVWVIDETEDTVRLDFNHPFAGKTLSYWIELVDMK